jgi:hypothetical protein
MTVAVYQGNGAEEVSPDKYARVFSLLRNAVGMATTSREVWIDSVIRLGSLVYSFEFIMIPQASTHYETGEN